MAAQVPRYAPADVQRPPVQRPTIQRDWYPTRRAAAMLGVSERTLRRRLSSPNWAEGRHYRWVTRQTRRTLEINVAGAINLMNCMGWI
jgi:hypothetical protein